MGRMCSTLTEMAPESSTTVAFHPPSPPPTLHHVKYIQSRVRHHRSKSGKQTLVSVSTVGTHPELDDATLESTVRQQMGEWFGPFDVASWKLLKIFRIPYAQPDQVLDQHHSLFSHFFACSLHLPISNALCVWEKRSTSVAIIATVPPSTVPSLPLVYTPVCLFVRFRCLKIGTSCCASRHGRCHDKVMDRSIDSFWIHSLSPDLPFVCQWPCVPPLHASPNGTSRLCRVALRCCHPLPSARRIPSIEARYE